ncbi:MAG: DUF2250 domain-containing protein [bacterium]
MTDDIRLKEQYSQAKCCRPHPPDDITGYFSHDRVSLKVHRAECESLLKAPTDRLVILNWPDILADEKFTPDDDYSELDELDWRILKHHRNFGVDYSLKMARMLAADKEAVFDHHAKLRNMGLLERVEPRIIQYRKGVVDNKWIKHRNHTYYDLTGRGSLYLDYHLSNS